MKKQDDKYCSENKMTTNNSSPPAFSSSQVAAFRLKRHHLTGDDEADAATITRAVCGIQAQVTGPARIALWARNHELTRTEIDSALWKSHTLVKTSLMRGTLHLVTTEDFPVYISALKSSRLRQMSRIMTRYGVSREDSNAVTDAVVQALAAGPMTRRELTERTVFLETLGDKARAWFEQAWWGVVRQAVVEGLACYGPNRGSEVTLVRVDQWLGNLPEVPEEHARLILLRRFLRAYGPSSPHDFSKWTSFSMKAARETWRSARKEVVEVSVEGRSGWILAEDLDTLVSSNLEDHNLCILPHFDCYLLGHVRKDHLVDDDHYKRVYRKAAWISPVVLLNGRIVGIWSNRRKSQRLKVEVEPFARISRTVRARIEEEAASLAQFLEASDCQVRFESVA